MTMYPSILYVAHTLLFARQLLGRPRESRVGLEMCGPCDWTWLGSAARHLHCVDAERTVGDIGAPTSMVRNGQGGGRLMTQGSFRGVVDAGFAGVIPYAVFAAASACM